MIKLFAGAVAVMMVAAGGPAAAQSIGYAQAIDRLAVSCGKDINTYCKKVNLGGGRVQQCLIQNQAKISAACRSTQVEVAALLQKRAAARNYVLQACDIDIRRLCPGVKPGDGNLLECFLKVEPSAGPQCRQAVTDAGYR